MKKYFLHINGKTVGPYTWHELRAMNLAPSTPVWFDGLGNWRNANTVPELQSLFVASSNAFSQQPNAYVPPQTRSTSFSQINYGAMDATPKKSSKMGLIIGMVVLALVLGGIALGYNAYQKKKRMQLVIQEMVDSMQVAEDIQNNANSSVDTMGSTIAPEELVTEAEVLPSDYTGLFKNYSGGSIRILGGGNELQIRLKMVPQDGAGCTKEISGTGSLSGKDNLIMTTKEGCTITLKFIGTDMVSIEENTDCDSFHGSQCSFVSLYLRE